VNSLRDNDFARCLALACDRREKLLTEEEIVLAMELFFMHDRRRHCYSHCYRLAEDEFP